MCSLLVGGRQKYIHSYILTYMKRKEGEMSLIWWCISNCLTRWVGGFICTSFLTFSFFGIFNNKTYFWRLRYLVQKYRGAPAKFSLLHPGGILGAAIGFIPADNRIPLTAWKRNWLFLENTEIQESVRLNSFLSVKITEIRQLKKQK